MEVAHPEATEEIMAVMIIVFLFFVFLIIHTHKCQSCTSDTDNAQKRFACHARSGKYGLGDGSD